jgi:hypothetical protein
MQAPQRVGHPHGPKAHDGSIITDRPGRHLITGGETGPCRSGTRRPAARSARSAPTTGNSGGWPLAATAGTWLRRASMER